MAASGHGHESTVRALVELGANGVMAVVQVMRDTLFRFPAGRRVHELTDPDGKIFVLPVDSYEALMAP
mgnify:CR=1 FL=1